jgi:hypothetical protein
MVRQLLYVARKMNVRRDVILYISCFEKLFYLKQQQRQSLTAILIQSLVLKRTECVHIFAEMKWLHYNYFKH